MLAAQLQTLPERGCFSGIEEWRVFSGCWKPERNDRACSKGSMAVLCTLSKQVVEIVRGSFRGFTELMLR